MIRILSSFMLALVLALTSQSMAVARGASAATGQMVICSGTGTFAVYVDAQGQPTAAPHICPDATLSVLPDVAVPDMTAPISISAFLPDTVHSNLPVPRLPRVAPPSRAPPLSV